MQYKNFMEERADVKAQLHAAAEAYAKGVQLAAVSAARQYANKCVPMMLFKADCEAFVQGVQKLVEDRLQEIVAHWLRRRRHPAGYFSGSCAKGLLVRLDELGGSDGA